MLFVTPIYAGILAVIFVVLSLRVSFVRRDLNVGIGDGGNPRLGNRIRGHGNMAETVPIVLILMVIAELQQVSPFVLHGVGLVMLIGRVLHAASLWGERRVLIAATIGMGLTHLATIAVAIAVLLAAIPAG